MSKCDFPVGLLHFQLFFCNNFCRCDNKQECKILWVNSGTQFSFSLQVVEIPVLHLFLFVIIFCQKLPNWYIEQFCKKWKNNQLEYFRYLLTPFKIIFSKLHFHPKLAFFEIFWFFKVKSVNKSYKLVINLEIHEINIDWWR